MLCLSPGTGPAEPHVGRCAAGAAGGHSGSTAALLPRTPPRQRDAVWVRWRPQQLHTEPSASHIDTVFKTPHVYRRSREAQWLV